MRQRQLIFFRDVPPSPEVRKAMVDPQNPTCPFNRFVGNPRAVQRLGRALFAALGRRNHSASDQSFALLGPASTGKTTLVKLFAEILRLPLVEVGPKSIKSGNDLLAKVSEVLDATAVPGGGSLSLVEMNVEGQGSMLVIPPVVIFIDEVHALNDAVVQALLKATEAKDRMLDTGKILVDCQHVCWVIATTDRGRLFDAFDTRFTKIFLELYTAAEIAQIVGKVNPDWNHHVCEQVAKYVGHVPREALAFAVDMRLEREMHPELSWEEVARRVAEDNGIDEFGMSGQRVLILKSLADGAISKQRLAAVAGCKLEELEKFIMPPLMSRTADQAPMVQVSSKGYEITDAGRAQLTLRGHVAAEEKAEAPRARRKAG